MTGYTITQVAGLLGEKPATVRRALDRDSGRADRHAPTPTGQVANAATYDPAEMVVWWALRPDGGRPRAVDPPDDHPIGQMLADWVTAGQGQPVSVEARLPRRKLLAELIVTVQQRTHSTVDVGPAHEVLIGDDERAADHLMKWIAQSYYRTLAARAESAE